MTQRHYKSPNTVKPIPTGRTESGDAGAAHSVMPRGIACLRKGYPKAIETVLQENGAWHIVLANGARMAWDDGLEKAFEQRLESPDLEDQLSIAYPLGPLKSAPSLNDDPGRIRVQSFFKAVYGDSEKAVRANLVTVEWLPKRVGKPLRFNRRNGAAEALSRVSRALDDRLQNRAIKYISQPAGTFNWRTIAGTKRLSAHSFGIALDINVSMSHYWRWEPNGTPLKYQNRIPYPIVEVFEKNGFIWGGKWYHYDTMHFEYRPELLARACLRTRNRSGHAP